MLEPPEPLHQHKAWSSPLQLHNTPDLGTVFSQHWRILIFSSRSPLPNISIVQWPKNGAELGGSVDLVEGRKAPQRDQDLMSPKVFSDLTCSMMRPLNQDAF